MAATLYLKSKEDNQAFECGTTTTFGRDIKNSIVLNDSKVSRSHAAIRCMGDGRYYLMDMGSSNGTLVNGQRVVVPRPLADLDEIAIGKQVFVFRQEMENAQAEDEDWSMLLTETVLTTGASVSPITLLVTDIRNYTSMSEKLSPIELSRLLARWCRVASEIVEQNGGVVDKFIGDAVMARWLPQADKVGVSVVAALSAAQELGQKAEALNAVSPHLPHEFRVGVGINTGQAVLGNLGGGARRDFTALGDAVNLAFRFEAASKKLKKDVVMGPDCHKYLPADVLQGNLHSILVKGKEHPINVCALTFEDVAAWKSKRMEGRKTGKIKL